MVLFATRDSSVRFSVSTYLFILKLCFTVASPWDKTNNIFTAFHSLQYESFLDVVSNIKVSIPDTQGLKLVIMILDLAHCFRIRGLSRVFQDLCIFPGLSRPENLKNLIPGLSRVCTNHASTRTEIRIKIISRTKNHRSWINMWLNFLITLSFVCHSWTCFVN